MKPAEIDWSAFESAVKEVCARSLAYLDANNPDEVIYGFGIEGGIEQGLVYVSANTVSGRNGDAEWWLPDWKLTYIDERLSDDSCGHLFEPFSEPFNEVVFGESTEGSFEELCRLFRLTCLRALRSTGAVVDNFSFSRSHDFSLVYMDEIDALYQGLDAIEAGINALETTGR